MWGGGVLAPKLPISLETSVRIARASGGSAPCAHGRGFAPAPIGGLSGPQNPGRCAFAALTHFVANFSESQNHPFY